MKSNPTCRKCGDVLTSENWYPSCRGRNNCICKGCQSKHGRRWYVANTEKAKAQSVEWQEANPEKARESAIKSRRKRGVQPFNKNKNCTQYLGVHVAERVLSHVFKDVEVMPIGNKGYDFICNRGKRIDVKSSCQHKRNGAWGFNINHNTTADFFLCLAFDTRENLMPIHAWLLPADRFNHLIGIGIRPSTIDKWAEYHLDITKINQCCDTIKNR